MGINIALCETEAQNAPCREMKLTVVKAKVEGKKFEPYMDVDEVVSLEDAAKAVGDMEAFLKRNRINAETDAIYMDKVKKDEDKALLAQYVKKVPTGWVDLSKLDDATKAEALESGDKNDRVTAWDQVEFDDMNEMCSKCALSWDKGRGCMGSFGPETSQLPAIAQKYGCPIIGAVFENAKEMKRLSPEDAKAVLNEVEILKPALVEEGKMAVHRYSGPLERIEAVAKVSVEQNCGFYFF